MFEDIHMYNFENALYAKGYLFLITELSEYIEQNSIFFIATIVVGIFKMFDIFFTRISC